jgi:hypothetical protein
LIDFVADRVRMPRIVSIACGHLREAALSRAIAEGAVGMETFMDWHLIYRDEAEIEHVAAEIDRSRIARLEIFRHEPGNLVFLEIVKGESVAAF